MANLWIHRRRPSSLVRYRHGGESAIFPPALQQAQAAHQLATRAALATASVDAPGRDNVLEFPTAKNRASRAASRPSGRSKAKGPKKRD